MSEARFKLEDQINTLCSTGSNDLDPVVLKQVKLLCRDNDTNCQYSYEILMTLLHKEHSEVRYSAVQIIDCLFQRSHVFRELLLDEFQNFFELVLETDVDNPLPPPAKKAALLKKLAAKLIKNWHEKFADVYKLLDLGFNYLKNCKKVDFVSFSHQSSAQRAHVSKEAERQEIFLNKKYLEYAQEMKDRKDDVTNCIGQLERCIDILKPNDLFQNSDFELPIISNEKKESIIATELEESGLEGSSDSDEDDDDFVEVEPNDNRTEDEEIELRYLGFLGDRSSAREYNLELSVDTFKIDNENKIVVDIMRDLEKELNSYLTKIKNWIKNFNLVKSGQTSLKEAIELKNSVQSVLKKFEYLRLPKEVKEPEVTSDTKKLAENIDNHPGTSKNKHHITESSEANEGETERKKKRQEMLKLAPVVNLDEVEFCRPITQQVETDHRFYGRSEEQPNDKQQALQQVKTTFVGKFEPVKWTCRAPLKNGKLCPRMDRFKCPLHGKIVARDAVGNIVNESDKTSENTPEPEKPWLDNELINEINAARGKKVIEMGKKKRGKKTKGNLTDINQEEESPRRRLERRLFTKKSLNKVGSILDAVEKRLHQSKFHHQYNYSLNL